MKRTLLVCISLAACEAGPTLGEHDREGNLTQGNLTQGNLTQGNLTQGNLTQGSQDAIWGFSLSGWALGKWRLKNPQVYKGFLRAAWDQTAHCPVGTSG